MPKRSEIIKLFGMSGYLLLNELDDIEKEHELRLGHKRNTSEDKDETYYPQFERAIRQEAAFMAEHYEIFYCLEKTIRRLILEALELDKGADWWNSGRIPQKIHDDVKSRIQREIDSGTSRRSIDAIDYTNFGELGDIITSNWDVFGAIFNSQKAVNKVMNALNTIRGPIAHCCPLAEDEVLRLKIAVRDWFRLME